MIRPLAAALAPMLALAACGANGEPRPGTPPAAENVEPERVVDSLVLEAPGGVSVWLTEGRQATEPTGATCLERTLEIRRDTTRIKVPLLYTISAPYLLNDSTMRAELAHRCRPAEAYRVDLRTGRPTPIRP
jgi:hypothetical protein